MEKEEMLENLKNDVNETIGLYESFITGSAIATRNMIERIGEVATLEKLVQTAEGQLGFKKLYEHKQLDKSFEALVLKYKELFSKNAYDFANYRLKQPELFLNK